MDIRVPVKHYKKYSKLFVRNEAKYPVVQGADGKPAPYVVLTKDDTITESIIMIQDDTGKFVRWSTGEKNIRSFLKNGFVELKEKCPFKFLSRCKGRKCRFYKIKHLTGDCGFYWKTMVD